MTLFREINLRFWEFCIAVHPSRVVKTSRLPVRALIFWRTGITRKSQPVKADAFPSARQLLPVKRLSYQRVECVRKRFTWQACRLSRRRNHDSLYQWSRFYPEVPWIRWIRVKYGLHTQQCNIHNILNSQMVGPTLKFLCWHLDCNCVFLCRPQTPASLRHTPNKDWKWTGWRWSSTRWGQVLRMA